MRKRAKQKVQDKVDWVLRKSDNPDAVRALVYFHPDERFKVGDRVRLTVELLRPLTSREAGKR